MKSIFVVFKRKTVTDIVSLLLAVVVLIACTVASGSVSAFAVAKRKLPIYGVDTSENKIALTFDAAWGGDKTRDIVGLLKERGYTATFFLVGFWVDKYPELVKLIDESGFEIGTHSLTHPKMSLLSTENVRKELQESCKKIEDITGKEVKVFRPPFGDYDNKLIEICDTLELKTIQWSIDSLDWKEQGKDHLINRVCPKMKGGDIILFHNNSKYIVQSLPAILDEIVKKKLQPVTVSQLVYQNNFYIDNSGIQRKN